MEANIQNWEFNYIDDDNSEKFNTLLDYSNSIKIQCLLDKTKTEYSLIEKTVYDISKFHLNRLNIDINNEDIYIAFWFKSDSQKCVNCTNLHMDRDDYEDRIFNTITNTPFLSVITCLSDNDNPTMITNINDSVKQNKNYMDNPNIFFSFPRKYKQISFNGGKYVHGETSIFENTSINNDNDRRLLIITFDKTIRPLHVPMYNESIFFYHVFMKTNRVFNDITYYRTTDVLNINKCESLPLYVMLDDSIINYNFFQNIIEENKFKILHKFSKIFKYILNNYSKKTYQIICDINTNSYKYNPNQVIYYNDNTQLTQNIIHNGYNDSESIMPTYLKFSLNTWVTNYDSLDILTEFLKNTNNSNDIFNKSFILNPSKPLFDIIEKYVYDIAHFHLHRMNMDFTSNITIEFSYSHNRDVIHITEDNYTNKDKGISKKPLLTTITYMTKCNSPLLITNIDEDAYKFKKLEDKNMCVFFPNITKHVSFDGGKYYHYTNMFNMNNKVGDILYVNLWIDYCPKNTPLYYSGSFENNTVCHKFTKDNILIHFTNKNENTKEITTYNNILNDNFFEKMLYKKNKNIFYNFEGILECEDIDNYDTFILHPDSTVDNSSIDNKMVSSNNSFFQKKIIGLTECFMEKEIIRYEIAKWMVNEIDLIHTNINDNINIDSVPKILKYIMKYLFDAISEKIRTKVFLSANAIFNFNNIFIIPCCEMFKYIQLSHTLTLYLFLGDSVHFFVGYPNNVNLINDDFTVMKTGDIFGITPNYDKTNIKNINGDGYMIVFDIDIIDDI